MAETDPELIEEIDAIESEEDETPPVPVPPLPGPATPNGGPYQGHSLPPVPAK